MNITLRLCATALALSCIAAAAWGQQSTPPGKHSGPARKHAAGATPSTQGDVMQSGAMQDAMGFARQAFGYAASHPNASEADKQAAAAAFMSGIFSRELDGAAKPLPSATRTPEPAKAHRDHDDDDD